MREHGLSEATFCAWKGGQRNDAIQTRGSQTAVGTYAQAVFRQLFADGRIAVCLPNLLYRENNFAWLKLSFPALATQRTSENIDRYYATPLRHAGTDYYLRNHW